MQLNLLSMELKKPCIQENTWRPCFFGEAPGVHFVTGPTPLYMHLCLSSFMVAFMVALHANKPIEKHTLSFQLVCHYSSTQLETEIHGLKTEEQKPRVNWESLQI